VAEDEQLILNAKRILYFSENDEAAFFEWLDKLSCVQRYEGELDVLHIHIDKTKVDEYELRELISLFRRYEVDLKQLRIFDRAEFESWFRDPCAYWHVPVFGAN
jgi:hypothetical protein